MPFRLDYDSQLQVKSQTEELAILNSNISPPSIGIPSSFSTICIHWFLTYDKQCWPCQTLLQVLPVLLHLMFLYVLYVYVSLPIFIHGNTVIQYFHLRS